MPDEKQRQGRQMNNKLKASLRSIDIAGIVLCGALALALFFLLVQPLMNRYNEFVIQRAELETRKESAVTSTAALKTAQFRLSTLQQQLADVPIHLQPARLVNARVAELTDLATKSALRVEDLAPGKIISASRFETVPIHFAGSGTYRTCTLFLRRLRQTYPDIGVASFKLQGSPDSPDSAARFTFELEWFCALTESASTH
jgi:Tfp pilus assembly protein PilO